MGIKLIKQSEGLTREISGSYSILNLLTANDCGSVSVAIGDGKNHKEKTKSSSDRVYFVLEGELKVDGLLCKKGNLVFISAKTLYCFEGSFKALLINSPAFKKENESMTRIFSP